MIIGRQNKTNIHVHVHNTTVDFLKYSINESSKSTYPLAMTFSYMYLLHMSTILAGQQNGCGR